MVGNTTQVHPTHEQILDSPAMHAPPGVTLDFEHSWSRFHPGIDILIAIYVLSTIVVVVRIYERLHISRKIFAEDYVIIVAWILLTAGYMPNGVHIDYAPSGVHQWEITVRQFERYLHYQYNGFIIWTVLTLLLKIAILLQYLRMFVPKGTRGFTFWVSHIVLWINVAYYIAFAFIFLFVCQPRAFFWDKTIPGGKCLDIFGINVIGSAISVASDLIILLLPQRIIFQLTLTFRKKMSLAFLFAIGILACITSAVRLYYNIKLWKNQSDITYQLAFVSAWGTAQLAAGFWIVCSPSIPKAVNHIRQKSIFIRLETSLRSKLHLNYCKNVESGSEVPTIGGGGKRDERRLVVSDVEFHELVHRTEASVVTRIDSGPA